MSINVTVTSNPVHVHRARMVLSDLDQIKKNERDRRRRLRLEQVRQQSKEISNRLLERAKNIAKEELSKLGTDNGSSLRQTYNKKIMEIQQKYQEDMADIGQAHASAALETDPDIILEEERRRNKAAVAKRAKEAAQQLKEAQEKETVQEIHQERLRQVRELENLRSSMVAKLPRKVQEEEEVVPCDTDCLSEEQASQKSPKKRKSKKDPVRASPCKITKSPSKAAKGKDKHAPASPSKPRGRPNTSKVTDTQPDSSAMGSTSRTAPEEVQYPEHTQDPEEKAPRKQLPVSSGTPTKADKIARYNPEDYTQGTADSSPSDSSSTVSDDSSYFSDSNEQPKCVRAQKPPTSAQESKVRVYDHSTRQRNTYNRPAGVVEKIDIRNEPNAVEAAREAEQSESAEAQLAESRVFNAQKRGECAILREKIRRDYQALLQNLDQFSREERKLKASQAQSYNKDVQVREERRRMLREQHKRRLDQALKTIIDECAAPVERVITLAPKELQKDSSTLDGVWQEACHCTNRAEPRSREQRGSRIEKSRQEQILDMLRKVERQKRLLLQEFGADLPEGILQASMKPLFESTKEAQVEKPAKEPRIQVIRVEEPARKPRTSTKCGPSTVQRVETAVQTLDVDKEVKEKPQEDKSVQVEVAAEAAEVEIEEDGNVVQEPARPHPIEPNVRVITHEMDSSESSSLITGLTIDIDKEEVKVTPKKRRAKRPPSRTFLKARGGTPPGKTATYSPGKRFFTRSLPGSGQSSPRKPRGRRSPESTRKIDIYVNKGGFNIKLQPEPTRTAVDASTQSSRLLAEAVHQDPGTFKDHRPRSSRDVEGSKEGPVGAYRIQAQARRIIRIRDTSDTSTSFASPPPPEPRNLIEALSNNTPILELLDSSANETLRMLRHDVSPVSTPETPSPRTMMMPSNLPHPERIAKVLMYASTDSRTNDTTTTASSKNELSTSSEPSYNFKEGLAPDGSNQDPRRTPARDPAADCRCKNPECRLAHAKFDELHDYALENCPEILKKYEDLQNVCSERIAALTNLIEKVRNEQTGMEFSVIGPADETSLMQLPAARPTVTDLQSVRRLVESIEAIHNRLAKTLFESQRIMKSEATLDTDASLPKESESTIMPNETVSKDTTEYMEIRLEPRETTESGSPERAKPRIIADERVQINVRRFMDQPRPLDSSPQGGREEDVIEKLSKEILEQSESLSKNTSRLNEINGSLTIRTMQTSIDQSRETGQAEKGSVVQERTQELKGDTDFVPLLAGIPKVPRCTSVSNSGRAKPPVTLHSAPYRAEIESSGHELSTIVEFDTPDTANKSVTKSPSPVKKCTEAHTNKSVVKPSVHVAPLLPTRAQDFRRSPDFSEKTPTHKSQQVETVSEIPEKLESVMRSPKASKGSEEDKDAGPGTSNKKSQCCAEEQDMFLSMEDGQPIYSVSMERLNEYNNNNKDKITSTSSNSFSGLSGISEITSTPSSELLRYASSPEEMETALKKLRLGWLIPTLKKTREASALSSSSNSDLTPVNTARRMISPAKKQLSSNNRLPDFSDVSSISIKEASKSTDQAVLLKGRTSTPKLQGSNSQSGGSNSSGGNSSENFQEPSDSLIVPSLSLAKATTGLRRLTGL